MTAEATKIIAATPAAANTQQAAAAPAARGLEVDANVCLLTEPQSLAAEAVRSLRTQIVARHVDAGRRALAMEILEPLQERQASVSHRPALLYRFNEKRYRQLVKKGFDFEL